MWTVHLPKRVARELEAMPLEVRTSLEQAIADLRHIPRPPGCKKLKGRLSCWRIRVGSHRILYDMVDRKRVVVILKVGPRKDVYRYLS